MISAKLSLISIPRPGRETTLRPAVFGTGSFFHKADILRPIPSQIMSGAAPKCNRKTSSRFLARWEGYGPVESTIIRYAYASPGGQNRLGSRKTTDIRRPSQIWLMGDTGIPKNPNKVPQGGYLTEIVTFPPDPRGGWSVYSPPKQPACRHRSRAVVTFCDGHVESWTYGDLRSNKFNIFATNNEL